MSARQHQVWSVALLAGQRPGTDPLARGFRRGAKAVIPINGRPMIAWVLDALLKSRHVGRIVIIAKDGDLLNDPALVHFMAEPRITVRSGGAGISRNIMALAGRETLPWPIMITTADHPLLTTQMVDDFLARASTHDLSVGMVARETMLARYPGTDRTWLRFSDDGYTGANLFALHTPVTWNALQLWTLAEQDRKKALRLFLHFGPRLAFKALTRRVSGPEGIALAGARLGLSAQLVAMADPDAGIDVDKWSDYWQVDAILRARGAQAAAAAPSGARAAAKISIFDLDRTLTRQPTYTALLLFMAWNHARWRLVLVPLVLAAMLAYLARLVSRRRLKEIEHALLIGSAVPRATVHALAERFADRLDRNGFFAEGRQRIAAERAEGRRVILATAANGFYVEALARRLGIDELVCTRSTWHDDRLTPAIDGDNCYGEAKREMVERHLEAEGLARADIHVRFFSDHASDRPTFEWSDEPVAVNPSAKLRALATRRRWPVLHWS
ncbi:HAD-IB family hydrolase [Sphingomonas changnyeongensis]|uniref:HAD-IB family hydrolase n=1 Tax=Sphingomonas changnyeongensis TaxID=2698679 RepID=A0A7Z2NTN4_9SPHN|nr:HAD-IB family hydrolase [Sphingomonas changnyeongensis]QHL89631.1 HAD-IB family hydrolase [Sphingomonas changnyeongensis]